MPDRQEGDDTREIVGVRGFEGWRVSRGGEVFYPDGRRARPRLNGKMLSVSRNPGRKLSVARAVLAAFVRPPEEGELAFNLDGDRANCSVGNLEWRWPAVANERNAVRIGESHPMSKLDEAKVAELRAMRAAGATYKEISARFEITKDAAKCAALAYTWAHVPGGRELRRSETAPVPSAARARREEILRRHLAGESQKSLAGEVGTHAAQIGRVSGRRARGILPPQVAGGGAAP